MSIYDERENPAYQNFHSKPVDSENPFILGWWTLAHDELLRARIEEDQWIWYWGITDDILENTARTVIEAWKQQDPSCLNHAWYNVLMYFAASRAERLGLTRAIRPAQRRDCSLCGQGFVEDSLPVPIIRRLGVERLDFCAPCVSRAIFSDGDLKAPRTLIIAYLQELAGVLERIPAQDFGDGMHDLVDLTTEERLTLLKLLLRKPAVRRVKELFGSWLKALIEAEILEDGARPTSRGTQCLARDGHVCLSLAEKTIDDFLFSRGIPHEKETRYPEGNFRTDFTVKGIFIEYFGLVGDAEYEAKMKVKQSLCRKHNVELISIYPQDLSSMRSLEMKLSAVL